MWWLLQPYVPATKRQGWDGRWAGSGGSEWQELTLHDFNISPYSSSPSLALHTARITCSPSECGSIYLPILVSLLTSPATTWQRDDPKEGNGGESAFKMHLPSSVLHTHTETFSIGQRSVHSDSSFLRDPETDKRSPYVGEHQFINRWTEEFAPLLDCLLWGRMFWCILPWKSFGIHHTSFETAVFSDEKSMRTNWYATYPFIYKKSSNTSYILFITLHIHLGFHFCNCHLPDDDALEKSNFIQAHLFIYLLSFLLEEPRKSNCDSPTGCGNRKGSSGKAEGQECDVSVSRTALLGHQAVTLACELARRQAWCPNQADVIVSGGEQSRGP